MKHAGIVLAGGASERMGEPKALLQTPAGLPLAVHQAELLRGGGCADVVVVLGADGSSLARRLSGVRTAINPNWQAGRFSSVQAGLRAVSADGMLILPVDTVGVSVDTIAATLRRADDRPSLAIRPMYRGQPGKIAWISRDLAHDLLKVDPRARNARLDVILAAKAEPLETDDAAILSNVNTPEDWQAVAWG